MRTLEALCFAVLTAAAAFAAPVIEVAPDGELKSPADAVKRVRALRQQGAVGADERVTIRLAAGTYEMEATLSLTAEDSHLVFEGAENGRAVLSGGARIGPFSVGTDRIWRAKVPSGLSFDDLWIDGVRAVRAKSPNEGYYYIAQSVDEGRGDDGEPVDWIHRAFVASNPADLSPLGALSDDELSQVVAHVFYAWDGDFLRCERFFPDKGVLLFKEPSRIDFFYWPTYETRYTLENFRAALDAPGEWFFDRSSGEVLYVPRRGQKSATSVGVVPRLNRLVTVCGTAEAPARDIVFSNVAFSHVGFVMAGRFVGTQAGAGLGCAVTVNCARDVRFVNCRFSHVAEYALGFVADCRDCSVADSNFCDLGGGGVRIGTTDWSPGKPTDRMTKSVKVENCVLLRGGRRFPEGVGIAVFQASDCVLDHNDIADFYYTGISVGWTWGYAETVAQRNLVSNNRIRGIGQGVLSDMGGIYTLGRSPGTRIVGNVISDVYSYDYTGGGGCGIYTDEGSTDIVIESNLVVRAKTVLLHQNYGRSNVFRNNIFAFPDPEWPGVCADYGGAEKPCSVAVTNNIFVWKGKAKAVHCAAGGVAGGSYPCDRNVYWCYGPSVQGAFVGGDFNNWQARGEDSQSVFADPCFRDPLNGDFGLKVGSPALKLGFVPFDYHRAGVCDAVRRSKLDAYRTPPPRPVKVPRRHVFPSSGSTGFEFDRISLFTSVGKGIMLTDECARSGRKSLKLTDVQGQAPGYCPHIYCHFNANAPVLRVKLSVRYESGANMTCDIRKWKNGVDGTFLTGPSLSIEGKRLRVRGSEPFALSEPGKWIDLEYVIRNGDGREAVCAVTASDRTGNRETVENVRVDAGFDRPNWIGFTSSGTEERSYWIDDFSFFGADE